MPATPGTPQLPPISFIRLRRFMPQWQTEGDFSKGIVRDAPRASIPQGGVYDAVDYMLDSPGYAYKRGGTVYAGAQPLGANIYSPSAFYADGFTPGQLLGTSDDLHLWKVTASTSTDMGSLGAYNSHSKPVQHHGGAKTYVIFPGSPVKKYNGSTIASLTSTNAPSGAACAAVYQSRLVLGNTASYPQRLFFGPATLTVNGTDIDQAWDVNAWADADYPIVGLVSLQNALLSFSSHQVERFSGIPPGTTVSNMDHGFVAGVGCIDARSISIWQNYAIFANARSIFMTNGVGAKDLLMEAGMVRYWQKLMSSYNSAGSVISSGILW